MSQVKEMRNELVCLIGVIIMIALTMLMVLMLPIFILNEYLPKEYTKEAVIILIGLSTLCGAWVIGALARKLAGLLQFLSGGIYCVLQLFAAIAFFDGISMETLHGMMASITGCTCAFLMLKGTKKSGGKRKKRRGYR